MKHLFLSVFILAIAAGKSSAQWISADFYNPGSMGVMDSTLFVNRLGSNLFRYDAKTSEWILSDTTLAAGPNKAITAYGSIGPFICVGTSIGGFYRSTDTGKHWALTGYGLSGGSLACFAVIDSILFTSANGIYRSTDSGVHWTENFNFNPTAFAKIGTILFAGNGGVFETTDNGNNWTQTSFPTDDVFALGVTGTTIFAANNGAVYRSTDSGAHWIETDKGLMPNYLNSFATDGKNLFIGTDARGIYRSSDSGSSWDTVNAGLPYIAITTIAIYDTELYAGVTYNGVGQLGKRPISQMVTNDTTSGVVEQGQQSELSISVYPNPLSQSATISYSLSESGIVTIEVSDALGRQISVPILKYEDAGAYQVNFDTSNLPAGMYWCRLIAGSQQQVTKLIIER